VKADIEAIAFGGALYELGAIRRHEGSCSRAAAPRAISERRGIVPRSPRMMRDA
jgi:hypothetical protein